MSGDDPDSSNVSSYSEVMDLIFGIYYFNFFKLDLFPIILANKSFARRETKINWDITAPWAKTSSCAADGFRSRKTVEFRTSTASKWSRTRTTFSNIAHSTCKFRNLFLLFYYILVLKLNFCIFLGNFGKSSRKS